MVAVFRAKEASRVAVEEPASDWPGMCHFMVQASELGKVTNIQKSKILRMVHSWLPVVFEKVRGIRVPHLLKSRRAKEYTEQQPRSARAATAWTLPVQCSAGGFGQSTPMPIWTSCSSGTTGGVSSHFGWEVHRGVGTGEVKYSLQVLARHKTGTYSSPCSLIRDFLVTHNFETRSYVLKTCIQNRGTRGRVRVASARFPSCTSASLTRTISNFWFWNC